ncbi:RdgB/HAM1 family non-canonical purine NTP pyrophosphatase [Achromobacter sp. GG226]|uniref:RdgB/HAM1 family non-canonical purine NTP pyrophosphatase n=1 Tax=Verticiella alkaliphila TaxID=2779529 RepID=UPI001C0DB82A|nr:RdgB/HAM1 family non-canonical purine NTP pyrophosphatase [Verticiella sp. GG226]MBU4610151.1 RdgB/HAM1 family non-canonical purine NTP pyrophosphatase [Verticiella sp. GG226]
MSTTRPDGGADTPAHGHDEGAALASSGEALGAVPPANGPLTRVVLASNNAGKLREFSALFAPLGITLVPQSELGVTEAEEPHATFLGNAVEKARHASRVTGLPALADDSGLCVRALGGAPGVYSARFAAMNGGEKSDAANNALLVERLEGAEDRSAWYVAVLALVRSAEDAEPVVGEGIWNGEILATPRGANGFGYDPYFFLPDLGRTAAELTPAEKNAVSHRALALAELVAKLQAAG